MCGIAGYIKLNGSSASTGDLNKLKAMLLLEIESRGGDATGAFMYSVGTKPGILKGDVTAKGFLARKEGREFLGKSADIILLHTRAATSGKPDNNENNHPLVHDGVAVVHNGIVWNDTELKKTFGLEKVEVDSIVIPAQIAASRSKGKTSDGVKAACKKVGGSMACGVWDEKSPSLLTVFTNGGSPLTVAYSDELKLFVFASTLEAINQSVFKVFGGLFGGQFSKFSYRSMDKEAMQVSLDGKVETYPCADGPTRTWINGTVYNAGGGIYREGIYREQTNIPGYDVSDEYMDCEEVRKVEASLSEEIKTEWKKFKRITHAINRKTSLEVCSKARDYISEKSTDAIKMLGSLGTWGMYFTIAVDEEFSKFSPDDYFYGVLKENDGSFLAVPMWDANSGLMWSAEYFSSTVCVIRALMPIHPTLIAEEERDRYSAQMAARGLKIPV